MRCGRAAVGTVALPVLLVLGMAGLSPAGAALRGDDDTAAVALLRRATRAAMTVPHRGTQIVATWTPSGTTTRVLEVDQDSAGRRRIAVPGSVDVTAASFPASAAAAVDPLVLLAGAYTLLIEGRGTVAGRAATVVRAQRGSAVAARLWVDDATGLLLREDVLDAGGRLNRMATFLEVRVLPVVLPQRTATGRPAAGAVPAPLPAPVDPVAAARRLGSPCPETLPGGFQLVDARQARVEGVAAVPAVHLTYSDGLSALSVFVQSGRLPAGGVPGLRRQVWDGSQVYVGDGWPSRVVWQAGEHVLTAVTDAPLDDVRNAFAVLPNGAADTVGILDRLGTVLHAAAVLLPGH